MAHSNAPWLVSIFKSIWCAMYVALMKCSLANSCYLFRTAYTQNHYSLIHRSFAQPYSTNLCLVISCHHWQRHKLCFAASRLSIPMATTDGLWYMSSKVAIQLDHWKHYPSIWATNYMQRKKSFSLISDGFCILYIETLGLCKNKLLLLILFIRHSVTGNYQVW